jgi:hypothetical protein
MDSHSIGVSRILKMSIRYFYGNRVSPLISLLYLISVRGREDVNFLKGQWVKDYLKSECLVVMTRIGSRWPILKSS